MRHISKVLLLTFITLTIACSGAKETTNDNTSTSNPNYPAWYGGFEFNSDSTRFIARATAVSDNPETAQLRAEREARALLESYISKELEDIRRELERDGSTLVQKSDFIMMLRNAHYKIEDQATLNNSEALQMEGIFRGFAKVHITKDEVKSLIENGLSSNQSYKQEFVSSVSFQEFLSS